MSLYHKRLLHIAITVVVLCSMFAGSIAPVITLVNAQEATEEPAAEPTPEVTATEPPVIELTEEPATATPAVTESPAVELTDEPTVEATQEATAEATPESTATEAPTVEPTTTPDANVFEDDFQDGDASGWLLTPGWQISTENDNGFLYTAAANETAAVLEIDWPDLLLSARLRVEQEGVASVALRASAENYTITLNSAGVAALYRSGTLLAQGAEPTPPADPALAEAPWRTLNIQALGNTITVGVDGGVQFSYTDPAPLGAGALVFSSAPDSAGGIALDDVVIHKLDAPATEVPATATPDVEITETPSPEATEEPAALVPVLAADFEGELVGWSVGEGALIEIDVEANHALLLNAGASFVPAELLYFADLRIDAEVKRVSGESGGLSLNFRSQEGQSYVLSIEREQVALSRDGGDEPLVLASAPLSAADGWQRISLNVVGGAIAVTLDDAPALTFSDETPIASGQIAFSASGDSAILLDNIAVYDLTPPEVLVEATATPALLTEESAAKIDGALREVVELFLSGSAEDALAQAADYYIKTDEAGRALVVVRIDKQATADEVIALIETTGGLVQATYEHGVEALVPLASVPALVNTETVAAIALPDVVISTSANESNGETVAQAGSVTPHSLDIIGWKDWNTASVTGSGVNVAVIDSGFNPSGSTASDRACWGGTASGGNGTSSHGMNVIEVICDIAPNANVRSYRVDNAAQMATAVTTAQNQGNRVIVITLDLGAHVSPGDGTGGGNIDALYTAIANARAAGVLVIASAGNSNKPATSTDTAQRYVALNYTGANTTMTINTRQGEVVNVSWSAWGTSGNLTGTLTGQAAKNRLPGGPPGYQFVVDAGCGASCTRTLTLSGAGNYTVQVQVGPTGSITTGSISGATLINGAGQIARPADSPNVVAVGAVCSSQEDWYPAMPSSSHGPIFAPGGAGPLPDDTTRASIKPDLVAPSFVDTSLETSPGDVCYDRTENKGIEPTSGFTGTSAAAAHVAGMAALLISNTNASMDAFNSGAGAAAALQDYLQTHSIDLFPVPTPGLADGYDTIFGSGLTTLGSPDFNLATVRNPAIIEQSNTLYVGLGNPGSEQLGTTTAPFISIAQAIDAADPGDRVIVFPGEYVSSIPIINQQNVQVFAFNSPNAFNTLDPLDNSVIWVNDSWRRLAGIYLEGSDQITIDGFVFRQASPQGIVQPGPLSYSLRTEPNAIAFFNTSNCQIVNNNFTAFGEPPVTIGRLDGSGGPVANSGGEGNVILGNLFENNLAVQESSLPSALEIIGASANPGDTPLRVQRNTFKGNGGVPPFANLKREAIIDVVASFAEIYSNRFVSNNRQTMVFVNAPGTGYEVQLVSNVFQQNIVQGPLVHLDPGRRLRFINNTVIGNSFNTDPNYGWVILRGNETNSIGSGDWINGGGQWEIHNNIIFDNFLSSGLLGFAADQTDTFTCDSIDNPAEDDLGARRNWLWGPTNNPMSSFGECEDAVLNTPGNNNIIDRNPNTDVSGGSAFVGSTLSPDDPYRPIQGSTAIDRSDASALTTEMIAAGDALGFERSRDGASPNPPGIPVNPPEVPELGAYELTPLTTEEILDPNREEDMFNRPGDSPNGAFRFNLSAAVSGGFAPYNFTLKTMPLNFSTNPVDFCGGNGFVIQGTFAYYCPPQHFYTRQGDPPGPGTPVIDDVVFEYWVTDATNADPVPGSVSISIFDMPDQLLAAGDAVTYRFLAEADDTFSFRLRPFVSFNNFRFSERGTSRNEKADYPFTINSNSITVLTEPGDNPNLFSDNPDDAAARAEAQTYIRAQAAAAVNGLITLDPENDEIGTLSFSYTATDARGGSVTNTIILEVRGVVPDRGLHDDTSFSFEYTDTNPANGRGAWSAVYSEISINNTLHQTRVKDDIARFLMIGEEFNLYMLANRTGGLWELKIDDKALTWTFQASTGNWRGVATGEGFSCSTRQTVTSNKISNLGSAPYIVSCTGLRDAEAHEIEIINGEAKLLQVDALALKFESDPLLTGVHDVNEPDLLQAFPTWTLIADTKATGGVARAATSSTASDATFRFRGTGIAVGTVLERFGISPNFQGASYDICITPEGGTNEICQTFNNLNTTSRPVWNVFRPFFGYDPAGEHTVRINVNTIPSGGRLVIDTIRVLDETLAAPLTLGGNENDEIGKMVFGNGRDDSWVFDTRTRNASNATLHSINRTVSGMGPFVSFQIPDEANIFHWYRVPNTRSDSEKVLICIDRAQGETGVPSSAHCREVNLRLTTTTNPVIITEDDAAFGSGWGAAWGANNTHTVEIFSLNNAPFNMDRVVVLSTSAPLEAGLYEEIALDVNDIDPTPTFSYFNPAGALNGGSFTRVVNTLASGGSYFQSSVANDGVFFQMNGTGFSAIFRQDSLARNVEICWRSGLFNTVPDVGTSNCRTYNNQLTGTAVINQAGRVIAGLSATPANFTVTIRNSGGVMKFDALLIHDELAGNDLSPDNTQRYETDFANRAALDQLTYLGTGWRTISGSAAKLYSGWNYDTITSKVGAGIVFTTDGANVVQIYRQVKAGNAAIQVCVDAASCTIFTNTTEPVVVTLPDKNTHVISAALTSNGLFNLDAIGVYDDDEALPTGAYEDNHGLFSVSGVWSSVLASKYTEGRGRQTTAANATLLFSMEGSIVQFGAFAPSTNQAQVCFAPGIVTADDSNFLPANCETWPAAGSTLRQTYQRDLTTSDVYTIRIRNTSAGPAFVLDFVNVLDGIEALNPGRYEETHPKLQDGFSGTWLPVTAASYSGGSAVQSTTADSALVFDFNGTGFQIGMITGNTHGIVRICYEQGVLATFVVLTDIDQYCYEYNNQTPAANFNTSRTVAGLPDNIYSVRLVNVTSINPTGPATVDYVQIFDGLPAVAPVGIHNENAQDGSGDALLQLVPTNRWLAITGTAAARFSGGSYAAVVDANRRVVNLFAGPAAVLRVNVPVGGSTTIVLDTGLASVRNAEQLLACVDHVDNVTNLIPNTCQVINTLRTQQQQVFTVTAADFGAGVRTITFRSLTAGEFKIDGFQVIENKVLPEGIYDDSLMRDTAGALIDLDGTWQIPPTTGTRNTKAYGSTQIRTRTNNSALTFDFQGSGFSIITQQSTVGIGFEICYVLASAFDGLWDGSGETCLPGTTDRTTGSLFQVGNSIYGLEPGAYKARLRLNDTSIGTSDWLYVDALAIFGTLTAPLTEGMYDDAALLNYADAINFGPSVFWTRTTARSGPTAGPYSLTETGTSNSGAIMQVRMDGNAMTLYQTIDTRSSSNVRVCLVIDAGAGNTLQCSEFSQNSRRTYFSPIMFFGLGSGEHTLIFENRVAGKRFNIDAIRVIP